MEKIVGFRLKTGEDVEVRTGSGADFGGDVTTMIKGLPANSRVRLLGGAGVAVDKTVERLKDGRMATAYAGGDCIGFVVCKKGEMMAATANPYQGQRVCHRLVEVVMEGCDGGCGAEELVVDTNFSNQVVVKMAKDRGGLVRWKGGDDVRLSIPIKKRR